MVYSSDVWKTLDPLHRELWTIQSLAHAFALVRPASACLSFVDASVVSQNVLRSCPTPWVREPLLKQAKADSVVVS